MCVHHNRKLEVICVDDRVRIWTNCALFGDHKNHDIREEAEVINEITLRTELLIDIYDLIEQNKTNLGDQKEIDDLYNQFMTKQMNLKKIVTNKFKEYYNELLRKEKDITGQLDKNFEIVEKIFGEVKNGPKKVMIAAEEWSKQVQQKMDKFKNPKAERLGEEYIAFEMLEDLHSEDDIIKMGEKVLEELDKQTQPPVPLLQQKLNNLTVQFDEHFTSKLAMVWHVPNLSDSDTKMPASKLVTPAAEINPKPMVQLAMNISTVKPTIQPDKSLLEDDNDLLTSFITDKIGKDDNLMNNTTEINFLNDIPDPTEETLDPSVIGNTDAAYDIISHVLENGLPKLDLSGRKLGDEFFTSMIESIIDFAEGEPLSITEINFANNAISDSGWERICEFLIIEKDTSVSNVVSLDLSNNNIKDKSVDILLTLCEENTHLSTLNLKKNQFKSKLVLNKLKAAKCKNVYL